MGRVRMYHYVPHRTVGNIFSRAASSISHAVSNAASTVKTAVKADIKVAQSNPLKALELPTLIGVDALKQGVNAGASLYTATTGQKQVLLPYSTNIGGAIAQVSGSDTTSALAAHAAGGIINQVLPVIPLLNKGIFALQNLIDPKSVNLATPATVAPPVTAANSGISAAADAAGLARFNAQKAADAAAAAATAAANMTLFDKIKNNIITRKSKFHLTKKVAGIGKCGCGCN